MLTDRKRRLTAFMVAIAVLIATPLVVMAADAFDDVPNSNVHHDDIAWLKDAGVTAGCNPPANTEFCPGDPVLRQQMASFMRRLAENQVVDAATVEGHNAAQLMPVTESLAFDSVPNVSTDVETAGE
ncbi:MAG TPA: S-layer homology domain-containing protein, partial [Acidimicrobiia bacterium]|nr:S-layer homology domain-containing protein [Acidimicrobiia bacterium]